MFGATQVSREERWGAPIGKTAAVSRGVASVGALAIAALMLTGGSALSGFLPYLLMLFYIGGGLWGLISIRNLISIRQFGLEITLLVAVSIAVRVLYPQIFQVDYQEAATAETTGLNPYRGFINHTEEFHRHIRWFIYPETAPVSCSQCSDENPKLEETGRVLCCFDGRTQCDLESPPPCGQFTKGAEDGSVTEEGYYLEYPTKNTVDILFKKLRKEYDSFKDNDIDKALAAGDVWRTNRDIHNLWERNLESVQLKGTKSRVYFLPDTTPKEEIWDMIEQLKQQVDRLHKRGTR